MQFTVLALPTEDRAALAESLLASLDARVDEDAEAAWVTEIGRRVAELDARTVRTIPWATLTLRAQPVRRERTRRIETSYFPDSSRFHCAS